MQAIIGLSIILAFLGYLLPIPMAALAWRQFLKQKKTPPATPWRHTVSQLGLFLLSLGLVIWTYAIAREWLRHDYSYILMSAAAGRWGSIGLFVIGAFAEKRLRTYLVLSAAGLLFFFGVSIGDVTI